MPRPKPGDNVHASLLAAEGGWQAFELKGGEWVVLILSVLSALLIHQLFRCRSRHR